MVNTPHTDQLLRVNKFIKSLENNNLFKNEVEGNVNLLGEIKSSTFHQNLMKLSELENEIIEAGMDRIDYGHLMMEIRAYQFCIRLETLKATFANLLKKEVLGSRKELEDSDFTLDDLTLGTLIKRINDEVLPINEQTIEKEKPGIKQKRKNNQELFYKTFRNEVIHRTFTLVGENMIFGDGEAWNIKTAIEMSENLDTLEVLINEKLKNLQQS